MTAPLLLVGFAVLAVVAGPLLRLGTWADRSPRLAIFAWQAVSSSLHFTFFCAWKYYTFLHWRVKRGRFFTLWLASDTISHLSAFSFDLVVSPKTKLRLGKHCELKN